MFNKFKKVWRSKGGKKELLLNSSEKITSNDKVDGAIHKSIENKPQKETDKKGLPKRGYEKTKRKGKEVLNWGKNITNKISLSWNEKRVISRIEKIKKQENIIKKLVNEYNRYDSSDTKILKSLMSKEDKVKLEEKIEEEKNEINSKKADRDTMVENLKDSKNEFETKKTKTIEKIRGYIDDKIEKNTESINDYVATENELRGFIGLNEAKIKKIEKTEGKLKKLKDIPIKLKKELQKQIKILKKEDKKLKREVKKFEKQMKKCEKRKGKYERKNEKLNNIQISREQKIQEKNKVSSSATRGSKIENIESKTIIDEWNESIKKSFPKSYEEFIISSKIKKLFKNNQEIRTFLQSSIASSKSMSTEGNLERIINDMTGDESKNKSKKANKRKTKRKTRLSVSTTVREETNNANQTDTKGSETQGIVESSIRVIVKRKFIPAKKKDVEKMDQKDKKRDTQDQIAKDEQEPENKKENNVKEKDANEKGTEDKPAKNRNKKGQESEGSDNSNKAIKREKVSLEESKDTKEKKKTTEHLDTTINLKKLRENGAVLRERIWEDTSEQEKNARIIDIGKKDAMKKFWAIGFELTSVAEKYGIPLVLLQKGNHYVLITGLDEAKGELEVYDPISGHENISLEKVLKEINEIREKKEDEWYIIFGGSLDSLGFKNFRENESGSFLGEEEHKKVKALFEDTKNIIIGKNIGDDGDEWFKVIATIVNESYDKESIKTLNEIKGLQEKRNTYDCGPLSVAAANSIAKEGKKEITTDTTGNRNKNDE